MLRRMIFSGILAAALLVVSFGTANRPAVVAGDIPSPGPTPSIVPSANEGQSTAERFVAQASPTAPLPGARGQRPNFGSEPIVIPNGRLRLIDLEEVPSQRDGVVLFIGTEIKDPQLVPKHELIEVQVGDEIKHFRRLKEGDEIQADQLLAMVDDTLARAEEAIKVAKVTSAEADKEAADKTRDEAYQRWETQQKLYRSKGGLGAATSAEDLRGAQLTYVRYVEEAKGKGAAIEVSKQELNQARKTLSMYEIRPKISGVVKLINKHRGEAVKSLEPILQIQNYERLRVDALLPEQYASRLDRGTKVEVEPIFRESPKQTLVGHRGVVYGVAVSKNSQIVSCSDDRTVRVWELSAGQGRLPESRVLKHAAEVRAVACTPAAAAANLCLSGDDQGNGFLWDLSDLNKPARKLEGQHRGAITCVAFSGDGQLCATGAEDREIKVWNTNTGTQRYTISGHHNRITALYFTPDSRLVSVGRDPAVRFWKLGTDRAEKLDNETIQRRRDVYVDNLAVSPDGKFLMDEQLGEMRVVSMGDTVTKAIIRNAGFTNKFVNFALFSPDGRLALTTLEKAGMLQLWQINFNQPRSYELRQFVSPVRGFADAKSAAFAPDGSFVAAAVNDRVYVWTTPSKEEVRPVAAHITNIEKPIEVGENQVKVTAELENPGQRLRPGDVVTMVAYPQK